MTALNIAVVGSGISGLSAAWLLAKRHKVTLFEQDHRLGGHSNTVDSGGTAVDTGFIVYNEPAYPNLTALFQYLDVPTVPSRMSFAVSLGGGQYEYAGSNLLQLIGQPGNLLSPGHWRLIRDLLHFLKSAGAVGKTLSETMTLGEFIAERGYSQAFADRHLLPMAGAIWSAAPRQMLDYPARAFIRFFENHGLLKITNRPHWRTVQGGSREYVSRLLADSTLTLRRGSAVRHVARGPSGVTVYAADGTSGHFDHVVLACHADQALAVLDQPTAGERQVLGAFSYAPNRTWLHTDAGLMPRRRYLWSSWNYLAPLNPAEQATSSVTYWMNSLQPLAAASDMFVSLNPPREPRQELIRAEFMYEHPVFNAATFAAQKSLWPLQGAHRTWYCGAYFGAGFHEDGLQAGLAVAEQLGGVRRPWSVAEESGRIHVRQAGAPNPAQLEAAA